MAAGSVEHMNDLKVRTSQMESRVEHIDSQVGKIWSSLSETRQDMATVAAEMRSVTNAISALAHKADQPPQQFNWGWLIAALSLVLTMAVTFTKMNIDPIIKQLDRVTERLSNSLENGVKEKQDYSSRVGALEALVDSHAEELGDDDKELYELQRRVGFIEGKSGN